MFGWIGDGSDDTPLSQLEWMADNYGLVVVSNSSSEDTASTERRAFAISAGRMSSKLLVSSRAAALSAGQLPKLVQLNVNGNAIGDAGAEALAAAVRGGGGASLQKLIVGKNAFGDASTEALRAACAAQGVAAHRDFFDVL